MCVGVCGSVCVSESERERGPEASHGEIEHRAADGDRDVALARDLDILGRLVCSLLRGEV